MGRVVVALACCALFVSACSTAAGPEHDASAAASEAIRYYRTAIIDGNAGGAYALLDGFTRERLSQVEHEERLKRIPGFRQPAELSVLGTELAPGLPEVRVVLEARTTTATLYWVFAMSGTKETGYLQRHLLVMGQPPSTFGADIPPELARATADRVASAAVAGDYEALYDLMESSFRSATTGATAFATAERVLNHGGPPLAASFKQQLTGTQATLSGVRPMRTQWYLLETTGGAAGPYYLKVDVVMDGSLPGVAAFSVVNFPVNGPPDYLK